jgi:hypothetical protein
MLRACLVDRLIPEIFNSYDYFLFGRSARVRSAMPTSCKKRSSAMPSFPSWNRASQGDRAESARKMLRAGSLARRGHGSIAFFFPQPLSLATELSPFSFPAACHGLSRAPFATISRAQCQQQTWRPATPPLPPSFGNRAAQPRRTRSGRS